MACLLVDPYVSKNFVSVMSGSTQELWPEIEYPDILNYLIYTTSLYTREQLKAYKSIDGYNSVRYLYNLLHISPSLITQLSMTFAFLRTTNKAKNAGYIVGREGIITFFPLTK